MNYSLPDLAYSYSALEPHIDTKTMEIHHTKHHAGYIAKLNTALQEFPDIADIPLTGLLKDLSRVPAEIQTAVRNNGGGHYNHSLFWSILGPVKNIPEGRLAEKITGRFGSFDNMKKVFSGAAASHFGSGWTWLGLDTGDSLTILTSVNQDTPLEKGIQPLLGLDLWEHAYYLKYQNKRPDYIEAFWNVVNWKQVACILDEGFNVT